MAIRFKDYYKILGVSRTATDDELRKAFRKLAREFHPDVAKTKAGAEDKFKEVNEAYEVLSDPGKRKKYDELGSGYKSGAEFRPPPGWEQFGGRRPGQQRGAEFEFGGTGFSDFFEQVFGHMPGNQGTQSGQRPGSQGPFGGRAGFPGMGGEPASRRGQDVEAEIFVTLEEAAKGSIRTVNLRRSGVCKFCFGTGAVNGKKCGGCNGVGNSESTDSHKVKIPVGIREGQTLRLAGQGDVGTGQGTTGDLLLRVKFSQHPDFRYEDGSVYYDLELTPWEAVLGTNVEVPTLDGKVSIRIPPGTQSGHKLRVRGRGLGARDGTPGDVIVVTKLQVPSVVTAGEKELWERLAKESTFKPRQ